MPHSYANNLVHVVFSTCERKPTIPPALLEELWAVMAGIGRNHRLTMIKIGGMAEHVHAALIRGPTALPIAALRASGHN